MTEFPSISGYRILEVSGRGGMSTVYRAIQLDTGREVALKLILSHKQNWLSQFSREAEIIASLEHPHILPVYDFGSSADQPYLVMRLLEGGSLADWAKPSNYPGTDKVIDAVTHMAEALDFSHARGILHRDVKPSNMLLDQNGFVYLSDFGLAVFPADGEQRGLGSAAYISPEQARGADIDGRADIYSLSVTLFELLVGEKPYTGETAVAVMVKQINEPVPNARDLNPEVSKSVAELIQWGMSKKPDNRPNSAGHFGQLLQYAKRNPSAPVRPNRFQTVITRTRPEIEEPPSRQDTEPEPPPEPAKPNRWIVILLAALVMLLALIAGVILWLVTSNPGLIPGLSPNETPIATEIESPTLPINTPIANDRLIYANQFQTDTLPEDIASGNGIAFIEGALQIQPDGQDTLLWPSPPSSEALDGMMRIDLLQSNRAVNYQIGFVCRLTESGDFTGVFLERSGGVQMVSAITIENGVQTILDSVEVPEELQITVTGSHKLELRCIGTEIEFFIDEFRLLASRDDTPSAGVFGVFTATPDQATHVVRFDNLEIERP